WLTAIHPPAPAAAAAVPPAARAPLRRRQRTGTVGACAGLDPPRGAGSNTARDAWIVVGDRLVLSLPGPKPVDLHEPVGVSGAQEQPGVTQRPEGLALEPARHLARGRARARRAGVH